MHFHTDQCHQPRPAKATILYAMEVPSKGGDTLFSNAYLAYETLPEHIRLKIEGKRALNAYEKDATIRSDNYENGAASWHPVVRTHPVTRRKGLYVNRLMTRQIEGLSGKRAMRSWSSCSIIRNSRNSSMDTNGVQATF